MESLLAGAAAGAVVNVGFEELISQIKKTVRCTSECKNLESDLRNLRPKLERVEKQLSSCNVASNGERFEALIEWYEELRKEVESAKLVVHECLSGSKHFTQLFVIENRRLAKRIQKVRDRINELANGISATLTVFSTVLAASTPAANSILCTHQLEHCCSSPGLTPAPSPAAWSDRASHSLPPVRTTSSSSYSAVSGHGTPGSSSSSKYSEYADWVSLQSSASGSDNAWDSPAWSSRLQHSRSEEVVSIRHPELGQTENLKRHHSVDHLGTGRRQTWSGVVARTQDAERWTREDLSLHRRHSIVNSPQPSEPVTSYAPSAPPLHSAPSEARMMYPPMQ